MARPFLTAAVRIISAIGEIRKELGPCDGLLYLLSRLLNSVSGGRWRLFKYYVVSQPLSSVAFLRPRAGTVIALTLRGDPLAESFPRPKEVIARRYDEGGRCVAATVDGQFAGFLWWQHEKYEEDEIRCTYVLEDADRCVWDYDVYVEPRFRFGRTLARLWEAAAVHLAKSGIQWSYSRISAFNAGSLKSHARLGAQARVAIAFLVIGPVQISWLGPRQLPHLSLSAARRPVLRLRTPPSSQAAPTSGKAQAR